MKILAVAFVVIFSFIMLVSGEEAGAINLSNNNIGDIVTIDVSANAVLSSNIEQNIITVLLGLLNQQAAVVSQQDG